MAVVKLIWTALCLGLFSFKLHTCVPLASNDNDKDPNYWNQLGKKTIEKTLQIQFNNKIARNVILFLGDGMSIPTLVASRIYKGQLAKQRGEEEYLEFEKFPHLALVKTYNVDRQVPDSAATATAFLSGVKANYETLGLNAYSRYNDCSSVEPSKIQSIADWAQEAGKDAGVVTTTAITHATPAALYAHVANRDWESDNYMTANDAQCKDIARQLVEDAPGRNLKVIFGGGRQHFLPVETGPNAPLGVRLDGRNLATDWSNDKKNVKKASHKYVTTQGELNEIKIAETDYVLGLFADRHMSYEVDRNKTANGQPSLAEMTSKAIQLLSKSEKGYFLLVEGGRIDHAHHEGRARKALEETLAMEKAIESALQLTNTDETLIIVTADHAHVMTVNGYPVRGNDILGIGDVSDVDHLPYTTLMYTTGPGFNYTETGERYNITNVDTGHLDYEQLAAVPNLDETHGGDDVAVYARGPMAHLFHGLQEQNYIAHVMAYASCIGPYANQCPRPTSSLGNAYNAHFGLISFLLLFLVFAGSRVYN